MSELKLLNCPFCGDKPKIATCDWGYSVKEYWYYCSSCGCETQKYHSKEDAIAQWNERKPMANIVEKLKTLKNGASGCNGVMCDNCEYNDICFDGEQSFKVTLDNAINIVKQEINNGENNT